LEEEMRTKNFVSGLNNSQKIRVICDGVGFVTTVSGAFDMVFTHQRIAVTGVLAALGLDVRAAKEHDKPVPTGLACRQKVYGPDNEIVQLDVQVDLL
jgi:hypothetical protein